MTQSKLNYILHLADTSLILGQRLGEWCGHGPVLEQDIALTNISLDLIGQARYYYQYAAEIEGGDKTEDTYPFFRTEREFLNLILVEQPNEDWAHTMVRQFFFDNYNQLMLQQLVNSKDTQIAAIASKALKEAVYHYKFSSEWMLRMGDGTEESHARMITAIEDLWDYTGEMFKPAAYETEMAAAGVGVDVAALKSDWEARTRQVMQEATLGIPERPAFQTGGKTGVHSEYLGRILTDLQYMQRAYPGLEW